MQLQGPYYHHELQPNIVTLGLSGIFNHMVVKLKNLFQSVSVPCSYLTNVCLHVTDRSSAFSTIHNYIFE